MEKTVKREKKLTEGNILKTMLAFAVPMILGNLLQQVYNIADTMVVGRFLGAAAIWWAIPVGWILADLAGFLYYRRIRGRMGA